ncbi:MAG TPA: hypothetical protein VHC49_06075 [Mycobacteriales bacterium]|nr:hypothetical protein [Mycobacteriales bacterium]
MSSVAMVAPAASAASGAPPLRTPQLGPRAQDDLPVLPALAPLLPTGSLRRGVTVSVAAASTSLALAVLAGPSAAGAWCALVGMPALGVRAAAELGVALERFALVPAAGPGNAQWSTAVAALLDGMDVVAVRPPRRVAGGEARRLAARARERAAVLLCLGEWEGADLRLSVSDGQWIGPDAGVGRLRGRRIRAHATGRGGFSRPRDVELWLPGSDGRVHSAAPVEERAPLSVVLGAVS